MNRSLVRYRDLPAAVIVVPAGIMPVSTIVAMAVQVGTVNKREVLEWDDVCMLAMQAIVDYEADDSDWYYDNCYNRVEEIARTWLGKIESNYHQQYDRATRRINVETGIRKQLIALVDRVLEFSSAIEPSVTPLLRSIDGFFEVKSEYEVVSVQKAHTGLRFVLQDLGFEESW